jgi:hypothetical protein
MIIFRLYIYIIDTLAKRLNTNIHINIWCTMDSQKVPGMMVSHCNGTIYGNAYLITFKAGLLRTHTRPIFRTGNDQNSLGARFGEYVGLVTTGMSFSAKNCCATSDVWLGALSWCRNHCPCLLSRRLKTKPPSCHRYPKNVRVYTELKYSNAYCECNHDIFLKNKKKTIYFGSPGAGRQTGDPKRALEPRIHRLSLWQFQEELSEYLG